MADLIDRNSLNETPDYDAGLLNDFGGGNVEWWHDYLRSEIGRANEFWRDAIAALPAAQVSPAPDVAGLVKAARGLVNYMTDMAEAEIGRECKCRDLPVQVRRVISAIAAMEGKP